MLNECDRELRAGIERIVTAVSDFLADEIVRPEFPLDHWKKDDPLQAAISAWHQRTIRFAIATTMKVMTDVACAFDVAHPLPSGDDEHP